MTELYFLLQGLFVVDAISAWLFNSFVLAALLSYLP